MSFIEVQFPTALALEGTGGPSYFTEINKGFSGYEQGNQNWSQALHQYTVSFEHKSQAEYDALLAMFHAARGMGNKFRILDHSDCTLTGGYLGTGDGTKLKFQLQKTYTFPLAEFEVVRPIQKPITSDVVDFHGDDLLDSVKIYLDGVLQNSNVSWDYTTGVVTFAGGHAPADGVIVTADCRFHVPVRFDLDQMVRMMETPEDGGILYTVTGIKLQEIRIPRASLT